MLAFAPKADPTEICATCLHAWHEPHSVVVKMIPTTHVGSFCFGCPSCSDHL